MLRWAHTISANSATVQDSADTTWSGAVCIPKSGTSKKALDCIPIAVECASAPNSMSNTLEPMADGSRQATIDKPEPSLSEHDSENDDYDDDEEDDIDSSKALNIAIKVVAELDEENELSSLEFLARGGYNNVWLLQYSKKRLEGEARAKAKKKFVLRVSKKGTSLHPYQVRNEVACLQFLAKNLPNIPAPKVYAWGDGVSNPGPSFILEEYIEGQRLNAVWPRLAEEEKSSICREIANVVADLGETRFDFIGGLALDSPAGPTIEGTKMFDGRAQFHSPECYNIGPYHGSKDYILSCYDREIYFYTHASEANLEEISDAFSQTSIADFVSELKLERQALQQNSDHESTFLALDAEPLVLVHEDFHAGNMLVRNGHLVGIVDWEFSGVYPLSELLGVADILQISPSALDPTDDEAATEVEEEKWDKRYREDVERVVRERGWSDKDVATVMSNGNPVLGKARTVMYPRDVDDELEKEG